MTLTPASPTMLLPESVRSVLNCAECGRTLDPKSTEACLSCGAGTYFRDGVLVARPLEKRSYFDDVFEVMQEGNHAEGTWDIFYREQAALFERSLVADELVVDIGCGPELPYKKGGAFVIGVDASFDSIRANRTVDLRVFASADRLPLARKSVDTIVCFYSVHHMTGTTVAQNRSLVSNVFREFARILKPSGRVMIFDVSPRWPFASFENTFWDVGRRQMGGALDMFFWKDRTLKGVAAEAMPSAAFSQQTFSAPALKTFPPIFSKPGLRFPRFLYPFDINVYRWEMGGR